MHSPHKPFVPNSRFTADNSWHIGVLSETEELLNSFTANIRIITPMLTASEMVNVWAVGAVGALCC
jgi:hypothetical protein